MRLLFITHDATRTGAPILLLHFLRAFKARNPSCEIDIIIGFDGPLTNDFKDVGRVFLLSRFRGVSNSIIIRSFYKLIRKFGLLCNKVTQSNLAFKAFTNKHYHLIFSNSITNGKLLNKLSNRSVPIITFVHELENSIKTFTTPIALQYTLRSTNHFLAPSNAVKENLQKNYKIPTASISLLNYYIPECEFTSDLIKGIRDKTGVGAGELLIGGIGTSDWRKGIDLFIQVALQIKKNAPKLPIKFIWVGASEISAEHDRLLYDIKKAGLVNFITILGSVNNPLEYMSAFDLFLLTSREDPYPLVVLEAAMLQKPIICFEKSGGAAEFLFDGVGSIVSYMDVSTMANEAINIILDNYRSRQLGLNAYAKYKGLHSEQTALPTFEKILNKFIKA